MHCLNLKITYDCTNNCSFCFSSYLKGNVITTEKLLAAVRGGSRNGCNELVVSGGEPTILPETLQAVLGEAESCGYEKYIIQTNGSGIANEPAIMHMLDSIASKKEVCVSFSVHGHEAGIHDTMSRTPGAFHKLMKAIGLVSESRCRLYTNTVISSLNIDFLGGIARMILPYGPDVMQFAMMHLDPPGPLSTGLLEAAAAVRKLRDIDDLEILKTEGIPYCLMYGMEQCVGESFWPNILDLYNKDDDYMPNFSQLEIGMRWKPSFCGECILNDVCMGIWKEHADEFSHSGVHSIS